MLCSKEDTHEKYAIKVVKSEPAYTKAALKEINYLVQVNSVKESEGKII